MWVSMKNEGNETGLKTCRNSLHPIQELDEVTEVIKRRWSADALRPQVPVVPQFGVVARPAAFPPRSQSVQRFGRTVYDLW